MVHTWVLSSNGQAGRSKHTAINRNNKFSDANALRNNKANTASASGWKLFRISFIAVILIILFTGVTLVRSFADESAAPIASIEEKVVLVDSGDTLWDIAESVKRKGLDTREAIQRIKERNDLTSSSLRSGDRLIIPASVLQR